MQVPHTTAARLTAEFVGVAAFVAIGAGTVLALGSLGAAGAPDTVSGGSDPALTLLVAAVAHGFAIAALMSALGHISGAHLNPAVTFAAWITGLKRPGEALAYIGAQLAGGVAGALVIRGAYPASWRDASGAATPSLAEGVTFWHGVAIEAVMTFVLVWVIFAVAFDRDGTWFRVAGLPVGLTVTAAILAGGALTGAAMNPARVFGPAVAFGSFEVSQGAYWLGALIGAGVAGSLYMAVMRPRVHDAPQAVL
jgi:aquaporin Z